MDTVIDIKKSRQVIRLGESEEAPGFTLDLTTDSASEKSAWLANAWAGVDASDPANAAPIFRATVDAMLGEGSWQRVKDWIADGEDSSDGDVALAAAPLVYYLVQQVTDLVTMNRDAAYAKYLSGVV